VIVALVLADCLLYVRDAVYLLESVRAEAGAVLLLFVEAWAGFYAPLISSAIVQTWSAISGVTDARVFLLYDQ
jgi:hypothetical protein